MLSSAADKAADPDVKVELSFRCADIYADRLETPERSFRAYERVLGVRPNDARAAAALVPLYERDEKWARLPALYEVLYAHADSEDGKHDLLAKLTEVSGEHLQDRLAAFGYAKRSYELSPMRLGALGTFEEAARSAGAWDAFVAALAARSDAEAATKEERRNLRSKVAEICATELGRVDEAVVVYRELVEQNERDEDVVQTLDRILRAKGRHDDLRWLFDIRVDPREHGAQARAAERVGGPRGKGVQRPRPRDRRPPAHLADRADLRRVAPGARSPAAGLGRRRRSGPRPREGSRPARGCRARRARGRARAALCGAAEALHRRPRGRRARDGCGPG